MDPWIGWIVGERIEATTLVPPPLMKRSAPNGSISKSRSFEQSLALVLVVLSPSPPLVSLQPWVDFVGLKGGCVRIFIIFFDFSPVAFAKKKGTNNW